MGHLTATGPTKIPSQARDMYVRRFRPVVWSEEICATIMREYKGLKDIFMHTGAGDGFWDGGEEFITFLTKRKAIKGQCEDFCPELKDMLVAAGLPEDALWLTVCKIVSKTTDYRQNHMVLAVETDRETLICCHLRGCFPLDAEEWNNPALEYQWMLREAPGRPWVDLRQRTLADLV